MMTQALIPLEYIQMSSQYSSNSVSHATMLMTTAQMRDLAIVLLETLPEDVRALVLARIEQVAA